MTSQKCHHSMMEAATGTAIGFGVALLSNALILPLYGMPFSWKSFGEIGIWFTLISLVRSYFVRRLFVWLHHKGILV